ncbi:uridine cytidine kinase i, putative [Perkinsus marinus ATCC 50983]|uniref:Uridine cytidine kinase i, putative n=1 Tax=Perkinsus marinus (strain ATCC 50983 / TXsc) TaxID=423536 RepID=C5L0C3_PERM5|nr:uridine cytidine kinase i, putative [Perkinsus marinus ATCC 50983]EER09981.1 uridine cytidine kinase i, putative [Perkinsus marinus ATCC 50983]|eukprot:XP_002778186.1 uridine cytidine kinase i, putative [Perkinsus marinus ATCC 50983]
MSIILPNLSWDCPACFVAVTSIQWRAKDTMKDMNNAHRRYPRYLTARASPGLEKEGASGLVLDMKVFTQEDADLCLVRRIKRDCGERGISVDATLTQYEAFVKPAFETFIQPSARNADIIVPHAAVNDVAISLLVQWIESRLSNIRSASVPVLVLYMMVADHASSLGIIRPAVEHRVT